MGYNGTTNCDKDIRNVADRNYVVCLGSIAVGTKYSGQAYLDKSGRQRLQPEEASA